MEYPRLRNILGAVFSIETGLSEAAEASMFERALESPEWRKAFEKELLAAASDEQTSWLELLMNDQYEVGGVESEREAKELAMSLLWKATFPNDPIPGA